MAEALTSHNVHEVGVSCLFTDDEMPNGTIPPDDAILVEGIVGGYAFHPERLAASRPRIATMLADLPDDFMSKGGGGMSFLNACMTRDGVHWGEHPNMGLLFALGIGTGLASYLFPREFWPALPGGVPYIVVDSDAVGAALTARAS